MRHIHSIYDTDQHFIIDPISRGITSESDKVTLIQNDHNSERFTFELPRYIEGHDMSLTDKVEVHYNNIDGSNKRTFNADIYEVADLQISPDSDDVVICSWLISKNATTYAGTLNFVLRFVCYSEEEIEYQWFTDVFTGIKILSGIYNAEVIDDKYAIDIIESWKRDIVDSTIAASDSAAKSAEEAARLVDESQALLDQARADIIAGAFEGLQGPQGEKGEKGDTGAVGPMGPTGPMGPQGEQGIPGEKGDPGATGPQGEQGPIGATGPAGPQGPQGIQGPVGPKGEQGEKGETGEAGIIAPVSGFFTLTVDEKGDFYAAFAGEDEPLTFEYDEETGNLYLVQEE
jgi:hypothetical protein